ncbi:hypothetical protein GMO_21130 [Gluconobacter morbifer G707]|uniref:Uncharacterized protein n=1 Tax=Gluconobacter morbifer G707 TaxID=1088869 RepID=G6XKU7_9PROT|nr:hypothetical protein GMO_21130 [Gluconobacter morbifer G707]
MWVSPDVAADDLSGVVLMQSRVPLSAGVCLQEISDIMRCILLR